MTVRMATVPMKATGMRQLMTLQLLYGFGCGALTVLIRYFR